MIVLPATQPVPAKIFVIGGIPSTRPTYPLPEFDHTTVGDEDEQRNMQSRGYCLTQELALEALRDEHTEHGKLAAERNYEIAKGRISEKAAAEVRAAEEAHGAKHLPVVPETPIRPRAKKADSTVVVPNKRHAKA